MASKKITDLTALSVVTPDDLILVVDMAGPTTNKVTAANFFGNVTPNTVFQANTTVNGILKANSTVVAVGNVSTTAYMITNNFISTKNNTPATSTTGVTAAELGMIWSDGNFLYVQANTSAYKRVAVVTF